MILLYYVYYKYDDKDRFIEFCITTYPINIDYDYTKNCDSFFNLCFNPDFITEISKFNNFKKTYYDKYHRRINYNNVFLTYKEAYDRLCMLNNKRR